MFNAGSTQEWSGLQGPAARWICCRPTESKICDQQLHCWQGLLRPPPCFIALPSDTNTKHSVIMWFPAISMLLSPPSEMMLNKGREAKQAWWSFPHRCSKTLPLSCGGKAIASELFSRGLYVIYMIPQYFLTRIIEKLLGYFQTLLGILNRNYCNQLEICSLFIQWKEEESEQYFSFEALHIFCTNWYLT